jgi:hypothetical protein
MLISVCIIGRRRRPSVPIEFPRTYVNYCMYVLTLLSVLSGASPRHDYVVTRMVLV